MNMCKHCHDEIFSDGPKHVRVSGPTEAMKGDNLDFECSTSDSNPPVDIWWVVDGRAVQVRKLTKLFPSKIHPREILLNLICFTELILSVSRETTPDDSSLRKEAGEQ